VGININIITPVGSTSGLEETISSVKESALHLKKINIKLILVLNNSIKFSIKDILKEDDNFKIDIYNINPIASRSKARNYGLDRIEDKNEKSFVMFLDAGDKLLYNAISNIHNYIHVMNNSNLLFVNKSYIELNQSGNFTSIPLFPMYMRRIVNPFLLGGIILNTKIAKKIKFYEGKKEDWIYWNAILDLKPKIYYTDRFSYIYKVDNISQHYKKKYKSILELRKLLIEKLKWGNLTSYLIFFVHFTLISLRWMYINIKSKFKI